MAMSKTRSHPGHGELVQINCRKCNKEVTISVIALSRLHHPPLCETCAPPPSEKPNEQRDAA